jgi:hypothetical protein
MRVFYKNLFLENPYLCEKGFPPEENPQHQWETLFKTLFILCVRALAAVSVWHAAAAWAMYHKRSAEAWGWLRVGESHECQGEASLVGGQ